VRACVRACVRVCVRVRACGPVGGQAGGRVGGWVGVICALLCSPVVLETCAQENMHSTWQPPETASKWRILPWPRVMCVGVIRDFPLLFMPEFEQQFVHPSLDMSERSCGIARLICRQWQWLSN
jgi:hypothetical protein